MVCNFCYTKYCIALNAQILQQTQPTEPTTPSSSPAGARGGTVRRLQSANLSCGLHRFREMVFCAKAVAAHSGSVVFGPMLTTTVNWPRSTQSTGVTVTAKMIRC